MNLFVLRELVIVLAASVLIIYVSHKVKLPAVVGFLLTGILIGPGGFSLVRDTRTVDVLAEVGVVMLLFLVGLEFTLERLKRIQRNFWVGGGLQIVLTSAVSVVVLGFLAVPPKEAVFYGFLVSLSSTAVVLKILSDRGETDTPQGQISLGILIFQDMAIVPMIALVPVLASVRVASPGAQSDAAIRERLLAEMQKQQWAPAATSNVLVHDGVVELWGMIVDERQRQALKIAAENIPGVTDVKDHLVWIEPTSGIVIEPPELPTQPRKPVVAAWPRTSH